MRLQFKLSPAIGPVPFNYNYELVKALHHWLGAQNPWHGQLSLYSFGRLHGGTLRQGELFFDEGATLNVSAWDRELLSTLVDRVPDRPDLAFGMKVEEIALQWPPRFRERDLVWLDSPVLLKQKREDGGAQHLTYRDPAAAELLTAALHRKMDVAGCPPDWKSTRLSFDRAYSSARTKLIDIKGIQHRTSVCPLIVEGPPEASAFLWSVGAGHNTGMGFGAIR